MYLREEGRVNVSHAMSIAIRSSTLPSCNIPSAVALADTHELTAPLRHEYPPRPKPPDWLGM